MRVLQVVHGFPPDSWAGTELVTFYLSQALQAHGHEVSVLARTEDPTMAEGWTRTEEVGGVTVVRLVNNHTRTTTFRLHYENDFPTEPFVRLLEQQRPDVVHFQHLAHLSVGLLELAAGLGYPRCSVSR